MFIHKNHAAGGENGSIMVGMFVFLCLVSQNSSEWEFFVPTRMDLGVKLLTALPLLAHNIMRQLIKRASLLVYNFFEFCPLTTFDS